MKYIIKNLVAVCALVLASGCTLPQVDASPESAMLQYAEAAKSFDAEGIAGLMHPEALQEFRAAFDGAFVGENSARARAELLPLFSASTYEEFVAFSDVEAFQRLNEVVSGAEPKLVDIMASSEYEILGRVRKDDEVFLTYTLSVLIEGRTITKEAVQRLKQHEGQWLLMLSADGEATIAEIAARY